LLILACWRHRIRFNFNFNLFFSGYTAFKLILTVRLSAAFWLLLSSILTSIDLFNCHFCFYFLIRIIHERKLRNIKCGHVFRSIISDCDETYNYWEPTHFLLYGKGFQTWEYSPEYALRSYLYILIHAVPAWIYDQVEQCFPTFLF